MIWTWEFDLLCFHVLGFLFLLVLSRSGSSVGALAGLSARIRVSGAITMRFGQIQIAHAGWGKERLDGHDGAPGQGVKR
jgi:hypothetical protein